MKYILTLLLLTSHINTTYGEELEMEKCQEVYLSVYKAEGKVSVKQATDFLSAISCEYYSSAEGGEFGSELIMNVLENSTKEFIAAYDTLNAPLQAIIMHAVNEPIHDGFNLQNIYKNIKNTKTSSKTKQTLMAAIKVAAKGQNSEIQE